MKTLTIFVAIFISGIAEAGSVVALHCEGTFRFHWDLFRANAHVTQPLQYKFPLDSTVDFEINFNKKQISLGKRSRIPFVRAGNTISWEIIPNKDVLYFQYSLDSVSAELVWKTWHRLTDPDAYDPYKYLKFRKKRWGRIYQEMPTNHYSCKKVDKLF